MIEINEGNGESLDVIIKNKNKKRMGKKKKKKGETADISTSKKKREKAYGIMFMIHSLWISLLFTQKASKESNALPLNSHIPK